MANLPSWSNSSYITDENKDICIKNRETIYIYPWDLCIIQISCLQERKDFIHAGNTAFYQRNEIAISRMYQHWSRISFLWCYFTVAMLFPLKLTVVSSDAGTRNISEAELLAHFLLMLYFHPVSHFQSPPLPAVTSGWAAAEFTMFETCQVLS